MFCNDIKVHQSDNTVTPEDANLDQECMYNHRLLNLEFSSKDTALIKSYSIYYVYMEYNMPLVGLMVHM